jgi:hypothetical protein
VKRAVFIIILLLALAIALLLFWPSPIDAVAFEPEPIPALTGPYQANNELHDMKKTYVDQCIGCEDLAPNPDGSIYAGDIHGNIKLLQSGADKILVNTGGRPLGIDYDTMRNVLVIADADKGLLSWDGAQLEVLSTASDGVDMKFTDDVDVGPDGKYYFSDASSKYGYHETMLDIMEHGGHGRLCVYDPETKVTSTLLDGLQFANGVATSPDSSFVLINETGLFSVRKYWLTGPKAGQDEVLLGNMPGFPDNISQGQDGIYWLTLINRRTEDLQSLSNNAFLKELIVKVPGLTESAVPDPYAFILGINGNGEVVYNYQDDDPQLLQITSVQQYGDELFFGSLTDNGIGQMTIK